MKLLEKLNFTERFSVWWSPLQAHQHGFEERLDGIAGLKRSLEILEAAGFKGGLEGELREKNRKQGEDDEGDEQGDPGAGAETGGAGNHGKIREWGPPERGIRNSRWWHHKRRTSGMSRCGSL